MPSFILRDLNPEFWQRVQAKAARENTTVKALILRLLATWLAAAAILSTMVGCAYHAPNEPSAVPAPIAASVPYSLLLGGVSGLNTTAGHATITAVVQNINGAPLSGIAVSFTTDLGTLGSAMVVTDANGSAPNTLTASDSARITATAGTLTSHVSIASQPVAATPTPPPTAPPADPTAPVGPLSVSLNAVVDVTIGTSTLFNADVRNGPAMSVDWAYGDGSSFNGTSTSAAHTYATPGSYVVGVTVTDPLGRRASASTTATVRAVVVTPPPTTGPPPAPTVQSYTVVLTTSASPVVGPVTLTAVATSVNSAPAPTSYAWDCNGDGVLDARTATNTTSCTYPTVGSVTATVVASNGAISGMGLLSFNVR